MTGIMLFTPQARPTPAPARVLAAAALLVFGGLLASFSAACATDNPPGGDCLKDDDCESKHCVQLTCIAPGTGQQPQADTGTSGGGSRHRQRGQRCARRLRQGSRHRSGRGVIRRPHRSDPRRTYPTSLRSGDREARLEAISGENARELERA